MSSSELRNGIEKHSGLVVVECSLVAAVNFLAGAYFRTSPFQSVKWQKKTQVGYHTNIGVAEWNKDHNDGCRAMVQLELG